MIRLSGKDQFSIPVSNQTESLLPFAVGKPADGYFCVQCTPDNAARIRLVATYFNIPISTDAKKRLENMPVNKILARQNYNLSLAQDSDIQVQGLGGELLPFQRAAVQYALLNPKLIIGDQMGLGKTIEAIAIVEKTQSYPVLVVCPASVKLKWAAEFNKWVNLIGGITVISGSKREYIHWDDSVFIINYDLLVRHKDFLLNHGWKAIIFDESQKLKTPDSQRSKVSELIAKNCPRIIMLSGTAILNRPIELANQLEILGLLPKFGGYWEYAKRYCNAQKINIYEEYRTRKQKFVWDVKGHSHTAELHQKLRETGYIRRTKDQVLKDLPPKRRSIIPVSIDNISEYKKAERDVARYLANGDPDKERRIRAAETLVRFEALKHLSARGKIKQAVEFTLDLYENDEKVVVFAHHRDIVEEIAKSLNCHMIRGDTPIERREQYVKEFQTNPECKLLVCNIEAAGIGIDLTAASHTVFVELPWRPSDLEQAEDRLHRIGKIGSVNAWYLIDQSVIDGEIWKMLCDKWWVVDSVLDGKEEEFQEGLMRRIADSILAKYNGE